MDRWRLWVRLGYLAILLLATLSSFRLDLDLVAVQERFARMLAPRVSGRDLVDGLRNVVLFAGWGLLWMVTAPPGDSWRSLRNAVLSGAGLSLLVESLQLLSSSRTPSLLDLGTNTAGALCGAVVLVILVMALAGRRDRKSFVGIPAAIFALAAAATAAGETTVPLFRQDVGFRASGGPWERLAAGLENAIWSPWGTFPVLDLALFLPVGAFVVAWGVERGISYGRAAGIAALGGWAVAAALEVAHGALGIQVSMGAFLAHGAAVSAGAMVAVWGLPAFSRRFRGQERVRIVTGSSHWADSWPSGRYGTGVGCRVLGRGCTWRSSWRPGSSS